MNTFSKPFYPEDISEEMNLTDNDDVNKALLKVSQMDTETLKHMFSALIDLKNNINILEDGYKPNLEKSLIIEAMTEN